MKIKILKSCVVKGEHAEAGTVVETDPQSGTFLVNIGKAEAAPTENPAPKAKPAKKKKAPPAAEKEPPADATAD